jgi:hypothetical protein
MQTIASRSFCEDFFQKELKTEYKETEFLRNSDSYCVAMAMAIGGRSSGHKYQELGTF